MRDSTVLKQFRYKKRFMNIVPVEDLKQEANKIFSELDISETSIQDYSARIGLFLHFIGGEGLNHNSFLDFKRYLSSRNDYAVSTKNKYLIAARVLLKELNRRGSLPVDITQNVKTFTQSHKHKRDGLNEKEIGF